MELSKARFRRRKMWNRLAHGLFFLATLVGVLVLAVLIADTIRDGWRHLDWQFLSSFASRRAEKAGILAALAGTLWVIGLTIPLVLVIGVATALFLEEYQGQNRWARFIQLNINNLAGVPSIIYGILGLAIFVRFFQLGFVVLAATLTMTLLILPIVIVAAQEAIRSVPPSLRQASLALGATKWQTISRVVLPAALPGILTGFILALSRAIGETAPLIMVGAVTYIRSVPQGLMDEYTVLPIQIYNWVTLPNLAFRELAAAAILVLLAVLLLMNAIAIFIRNRYQNRY
ncbi:MAG: phosphate ABC transporter, permease protein PstA [Bacillus thermozeamaize]|jgi:phosphate transport system permease protein|uniref:Phosphate transport system permease protein PstA n=1 Tax=Bacillus thermozeamaize TaxID=230954 RepID=A0A1Y3PGM9_9BACI|nr:MAG: phosphate ABC transporter, permease protein PstA [Bacillus thermozeamaize]